MTYDELCLIVQAGEGERLEFKRSTAELDGALQSVCAFLNGGQGGHVLIGVADDKRIEGQTVADDTLKRIANSTRDRIEPVAPVRIDHVPLSSDKTVVVLTVEADNGIYYLDGLPFERLGSTTRRMAASTHQNKLLDHLHASDRWELKPAVGIDVDDLDAVEIVRTLNESVRRQRMSEPGARDVREMLVGMRLIEDGRLLNAGAVLFGKPDALRNRFAQCSVKLARFKGVTEGVTEGEFIDNRQEIGHIFELLTRADNFMRGHLPVAGRIVPNSFERVDDPLYPPVALREALMNAFAHRDYRIGGGSVSVAIFDDRLEISSVGPLHFGLQVDDLLRTHPSRPWNPTIANVLYRRGFIEQWGGGTLRMIEATRQAGMPPPEFHADRHRVTVRFRAAGYLAPTRVSHDLTPIQRLILQAISVGGQMSLSRLVEVMGEGFSPRTIQDNLQILRSLGMVDLTGHRNSYRWRLSLPQTVEPVVSEEGV